MRSCRATRHRISPPGISCIALLPTETQLNTAVAVGRTGPGPLGVYVVSVGSLAAGPVGALAGYLAMVTPAFLAISLAAAGLLVSATMPLGRAAVHDWLTAAVAGATFLLLAFTKVETLWVIPGSAAGGAAARLFT